MDPADSTGDWRCRVAPFSWHAGQFARAQHQQTRARQQERQERLRARTLALENDPVSRWRRSRAQETARARQANDLPLPAHETQGHVRGSMRELLYGKLMPLALLLALASFGAARPRERALPRPKALRPAPDTTTLPELSGPRMQSSLVGTLFDWQFQRNSRVLMQALEGAVPP